MAGGSITYTTEEQKKLFQDVLDGRVHLFALPTVLYRRIAEEMTTTVFKAFNLDFNTNLENPDFATPRALKRNLYDFSAAKTFQEIQDMQNFIFNEKGMRRSFSEFEAHAKTIFDTYNKNWLEAEFETATRLAESSNDWKQYTDEAEIFPLLKYNTLEDGSVREEHVALNGIVKPVTDAFWNTYNPPNGWRCRCFVEQLEAGEAPITEDPKEPELPKLFNFNAGKDDVVFHTSGAKMHPYFKVKSRFRRHKENNFGLPLPPDVANLKPKTLKKQKVEVKTDTEAPAFTPAKNIKEAKQRIEALGVDLFNESGLSIEYANNTLKALEIVPLKARPNIISDFTNFGKMTGRKLSAQSNRNFGVYTNRYDLKIESKHVNDKIKSKYKTRQTLKGDTIIDENISIVSFNKRKFKTPADIVKRKIEIEKLFKQKGERYYINSAFESDLFTMVHEFGHVYDNATGATYGKTPLHWALNRWHGSTKIGHLKENDGRFSEAFADAFADFYLKGGANLPDYLFDEMKKTLK